MCIRDRRHPRLLPGRRRLAPRRRGHGDRDEFRPARQPDLARGRKSAELRTRPLRHRRGRRPLRRCTEPSNVQAGGGACPVRFRCAGCDHFRTDVSYLPDLTGYLDDLLRTRERLAAAIDGVDERVRAMLEAASSTATAVELRLQLEERDQDLAAARAANRELIAQLNTAAPRR